MIDTTKDRYWTIMREVRALKEQRRELSAQIREAEKAADALLDGTKTDDRQAAMFPEGDQA